MLGDECVFTADYFAFKVRREAGVILRQSYTEIEWLVMMGTLHMQSGSRRPLMRK